MKFLNIFNFKKVKSFYKNLKPIERALLLGCILVLICSIFWLHNLLTTYETIIDRLPDKSNEAREYSEENIKNPVRGLLYDEDATTEKYQKARDEKEDHLNNFIKDKRNLNAQEGMWEVATELLRFTAYQLFFLVITTIASFAGLYFIIQTLNATVAANKNSSDAIEQAIAANDIARENLHISNRPICDLYLSEFGERRTISGNFDVIEFHFEIINFGKTPATNAFQHFFVVPFGHANPVAGESISDMTPYYMRLRSQFPVSSNEIESAQRNLILPTRLSEDQVEVLESIDNKARIPLRSAEDTEPFFNNSPVVMSTALVPPDANEFSLISMTYYNSMIEDKQFSLFKTYSVERKNGVIHTLSERRSLTYMNIQ